uniref:Uncharacterized protein n=1 Tax=Megaselia scalaris TaxID=36166 RepID=T1GPI2_MEGSC
MKMDPSIEDEDEKTEQEEDQSNQQVVAEAMVELSGTG